MSVEQIISCIETAKYCDVAVEVTATLPERLLMILNERMFEFSNFVHNGVSFNAYACTIIFILLLTLLPERTILIPEQSRRLFTFLIIGLLLEILAFS